MIQLPTWHTVSRTFEISLGEEITQRENRFQRVKMEFVSSRATFNFSSVTVKAFVPELTLF